MKEPIREEDLPEAWTKPRKHARLHILRAHKASKAVIIRRKPSKVFHIISWDTATDELEYGSWFEGRFFPEYCDLSWDGEWMVYIALVSGLDGWNGICNPPWLEPTAGVPIVGIQVKGGIFSDSETLTAIEPKYSARSLNELNRSKPYPFSIQSRDFGDGSFGTLDRKLKRDGWRRKGNLGEDIRARIRSGSYSHLYPNDSGWSSQPTKRHPTLRMFYRGYIVGEYTFEFQLEGSNLLGPEVDWATWDAKGDLLVARNGAIERYSLKALETGVPDFRCDLEHLTPLEKPAK